MKFSLKLSINAVKDSLESELSSVFEQNKQLSRDLTTLTSEHDALKAAYHSLESETISNDGSGAQAEKRLKIVGEMVLDLQAELAGAVRRSMELEKLPAIIAELELKLRKSEDEKFEISGQLRDTKEELVSYKKLTENLKKKLRELSSGSNQEFMDSFEEVMRDEMMTMKGAFEAKLRSNKEDAEAISKRHAQEIQRIYNASPLLSVKKNP